MGFLGEFVLHPPLSLLYLSTELVKYGFHVEIIDCRIIGSKWRETFIKSLDENVILAGCTVMTGTPIIGAIEASKIAKERNVPTVWGGAHPTCLPEQTLKEDFIDYIIRGYGAEAILKLAKYLTGTGDISLESIHGLSYKNEDKILHNPIKEEFEIVNWKDIPYSLIKDYTAYHQLDHSDIVFPIYSVFGCPYKCTFCISPARYKNIRKKWVPLAASEIVDHIEYLKNYLGATYIYFYDEDSFVKLSHIGDIIAEIKARGLEIKLGFRGARIDEIIRMDDAYLANLVEAGTNMLHVGFESGSQKILDLFKKETKVEDIKKANQILARNNNMQAIYNWIIGTPTETAEDLIKTKEVILQIIHDNPRAIIPRPNLFQPIPGTPMHELAIENGYQSPKKLEEWINMEQNVGDFEAPWINSETLNLMRLLYIASFFIDKKMNKVSEGRSILLSIVKFCSRIYFPIINFRVRKNFHQFFIEYHIFKMLERLLKVVRQ